VIELRPASEIDLDRLARLFTAAYEGYYIPFTIDERTLRFMVDAYDFDLDASLVAKAEGVPIGLLNLGIRGQRSWIGGVAVVPPMRRRGIGRKLMEAALASARERRLSEVWLEVLVQNEPAQRLYERLGFETTRTVEVWVLDRAAGHGRTTETSLDAARARVRRLRLAPEPWQRADETVDHLTALDPPPRGLASERGAAVYRRTPQALSLIQIAGDEDAARELLSTLRANAAVNLLNLPADEPSAAALRQLGGRVAASQYEMRLGL
jgi:ribosomal protein S18 acetylase RimI-like enzyme